MEESVRTGRTAGIPVGANMVPRGMAARWAGDGAPAAVSGS